MRWKWSYDVVGATVVFILCALAISFVGVWSLAGAFAITP